MPIRFRDPLVPGRFLRRLNRFAALVELEGTPLQVHVRNSGRLRELLIPGRPVWLEPSRTPGRHTRFTLALVRLPSGYVSVDAHLPNALVAEALRRGAIPGLGEYSGVQPEAPLGQHRVDFLLEGESGACLLEVKSASLVREGVALFPDAPTERGRAHLALLAAARRGGVGAAVLFIIQRRDVHAFTPNQDADPAFAAALRRAAREGIRILAMRCRVTRRGLALDAPVPVRWPRSLPKGSERR
jgi:sugar fermentation stimulation protein A